MGPEGVCLREQVVGSVLVGCVRQADLPAGQLIPSTNALHTKYCQSGLIGQMIEEGGSVACLVGVVGEHWPDCTPVVLDEVVVVSLDELLLRAPIVVFGHPMSSQVCVNVYQFAARSVPHNGSQYPPIFVELSCFHPYYFPQYHFAQYIANFCSEGFHHPCPYLRRIDPVKPAVKFLEALSYFYQYLHRISVID